MMIYLNPIFKIMKKKGNKKLEEPRSMITGSGKKQISLKPAGKHRKINGTWKQYSGEDVSGDFRTFSIGKNRNLTGSHRKILIVPVENTASMFYQFLAFSCRN